MRFDRRTFARLAALGAAGLAIPAPPFATTAAAGLATARASQASGGRDTQKLNIRIGHTGITWPWGNAPGPGPMRLADAAAIEQVVRDIAGLGFDGIELFGWQIDGMEAHGGLGRLLEKYNLPLIASYGGPNLTDPAQRKTSLDRTVATARLVKKYGGKVIVFGPNGVQRATFNFAEHKAGIVDALNEGAKAVTDLGLTPVLHQHTGTCIETREETYAVMEAVDTRYLKFGPDIGQLQKGGSDPVQVVKDFLPIIHHMHLKDFVGGAPYLGYSPVGQGKVNIPAILAMMNGRPMDGMVMVELDSSPDMPIPAEETARIAKAYLMKQGISFRN